MQEIVINRCFGGYSLSKEAYEALGLPWDTYGFAFDRDRTNPELVRVVKELGQRANGRCAELIVVSIPDDVEYYIHDYDGFESVHETHREWP